MSTPLPGLPVTALVSTYVPRRCGIASFTRDLRAGLLVAAGRGQASESVRVAAVERAGERLPYPEEVRYLLPADDRAAYRKLAADLERDGVQAVVLQHEYGIFGGEDGEHVLEFVEALRLPLVTTLHTVLGNPSRRQREILTSLASRSNRVVVMTNHARRLVVDGLGVDPDAVVVIPHGVPDVPFVDPDDVKPRLGLGGRRVILTFGLLSPNKRVEGVLDALPRIEEAVPHVLKIVLRERHPQVLRRRGEEYRASLVDRARALGIDGHVQLIDRYTEQQALIAYLQAADVFATPYGDVEQATSGTLAYALACGKAIVSTPYEHARELLEHGRGVLVPFDDVAAMADAMRCLLTDAAARDALRLKAYQHGRSMIWPAVGARYRDVLASDTDGSGRGRRTRPVHLDGAKGLDALAIDSMPVPPVVRSHLHALDGPFGMYQHANGANPDPRYGYCTDDVARRLVVDLLHAKAEPSPDTDRSIRRCLTFLSDAFEPGTGRFRNLRRADGGWYQEIGSEDAHGRAILALGEALDRSVEPDIRRTAASLLDAALPAAARLQHLRTWAYTILGCDAALRHEVRGAPRDMLARGATRDTMVRDATGDTMVRDATGDMMVRDATRDMMVRLATRLADAFPVSSTRENDAWPWPEDTVTYDNAVLPQALLAAGHRLGRVEWVALGTRVLEWLARTQTSPSGYLTPIGNRGWWNRGSEPARFDQQPIEAASLLDASYTAWRVTGAACWLQLMGRAWQWFLGRNGMRTPLADAARGACHDGLGLEGANRNQGAESTLAWLLAVERMREIEREVATADAPWQAGDTWQGSNSPAATTRLPSVVKA